jgi:hypothetical protein
VTDLPIYSPSETEKYLQCPRLSVIERVLEPRTAKWTPYIALGNAIHAGLAAYYDPTQPERLITSAVDATSAVLNSEFQDQDDWTREGLWSLAGRGLKAAIDADVLQGVVLGTELSISRMRLDVLERYPDGLQSVDWKVKLKLEQRNLQYVTRDFDPSWQLLQNAWGVRQAYGETPTWARAVLIVLSPRVFVHSHSIRITDARLDDFQTWGYRHWQHMDEDREAFKNGILPPGNTRSCHAYGRKCDFYDFCHEFAGDMEAAKTLYQEREDTRSDEEHRGF